ncbi:MAG: hypothetical protein U1E30_07255 [Rhodoblastus sp.]
MTPMATGELRCVVVPSPSLPLELLPQLATSPVSTARAGTAAQSNATTSAPRHNDCNGRLDPVGKARRCAREKYSDICGMPPTLNSKTIRSGRRQPETEYFIFQHSQFSLAILPVV